MARLRIQFHWIFNATKIDSFIIKKYPQRVFFYIWFGYFFVLFWLYAIRYGCFHQKLRELRELRVLVFRSSKYDVYFDKHV